MPNPFVHVELQTKDLQKAKEFYARLFDWKLDDIPVPGGTGSYTMIDVGGGTGGGMFSNAEADMPSHWLAYVGVDDVRVMTAKARELGAKICLEVTDVGSFGSMSIIVDPTGAELALWQAKAKPPG